MMGEGAEVARWSPIRAELREHRAASGESVAGGKSPGMAPPRVNARAADGGRPSWLGPAIHLDTHMVHDVCALSRPGPDCPRTHLGPTAGGNIPTPGPDGARCWPSGSAPGKMLWVEEATNAV